MAIIYLLCLGLLALAGLYLVFLGLGFPLRPLSMVGSKRIMFSGFSLVCVALEIGFLWLVVTKAPSPQAAVVQVFKSTMAYSAATAMRSKMVFPIQVDNDIKLIAVKSNNGNIVHEFYVQAADVETFRGIMGEVKTSLDKSACTRADYQPIFKAGLGMELQFHESGTPYVETMVYTPERCGM